MRSVILDAKGENKGHYVPGVVSGGMLYVSGQLSLDLDTREVAQGGVAEHAALALKNLDKVLVAAGATREDVVFCRIYVADEQGWDAVNVEYAKFFGSHKPARCVVTVPSIHFGCLVEVEAIAECRE